VEKKPTSFVVIAAAGCGGCGCLLVLFWVFGGAAAFFMAGGGPVVPPTTTPMAPAPPAPVTEAPGYDDLAVLASEAQAAIVAAAFGNPHDARFDGPDATTDLRGTDPALRTRLGDTPRPLFTAVELEAVAGDRYVRGSLIVLDPTKARFSTVSVRMGTPQIGPTAGLAELDVPPRWAIEQMIDDLSPQMCDLPWLVEEDLRPLELSYAARRDLIRQPPDIYAICTNVGDPPPLYRPRIDDVTVLVRMEDGEVIGLRSEWRVESGRLVLSPVTAVEVPQ
jgi:hypothetical protein